MRRNSGKFLRIWKSEIMQNFPIAVKIMKTLNKIKQELLGINVNIAIKRNLRPRIGQQILKEVISL